MVQCISVQCTGLFENKVGAIFNIVIVDLGIRLERQDVNLARHTASHCTAQYTSHHPVFQGPLPTTLYCIYLSAARYMDKQLVSLSKFEINLIMISQEQCSVYCTELIMMCGDSLTAGKYNIGFVGAVHFSSGK